MQGTIKWFYNSKDYGSIGRDDSAISRQCAKAEDRIFPLSRRSFALNFEGLLRQSYAFEACFSVPEWLRSSGSASKPDSRSHGAGAQRSHYSDPPNSRSTIPADAQ